MLAIVLALSFSQAAHASPRHYTYGEALSHPAGCPRIKFCGCGVALKVFGKLVTKGTWAIANYWGRNLKRVTKAMVKAGDVAYWPGRHVAYIEAVNGTEVTLYNPNGGRHGTWRRTIELKRIPVILSTENR